MLDLLIIGGSCPDYQLGKMVKRNIGIQDGRIVCLSAPEAPLPEAAETIDAAGKVVSPGFIDIHMHEENFADEGPDYVIAQRMLEMGVTTAVGGNCGTQYQPLSEFKSVLRENGGSPVNYIMLAGYNWHRLKLGLGHYDHASQAQMDILRQELRRELAEGAWGISFGLEYDPGITYEEMRYAVGASGDPGHLAAAHFRTDCMENLDSIREMIRLSREIPQKFQISHLSSCSAIGRMRESLECINKAMETDPKLNYDTYPYNAFCTEIGSAVFDEDILKAMGKGYDSIFLTGEPYRNVYCTEEIFRKARAEYPKMLAVGIVMNEDEIQAAIANPNGMVASDAILSHGGGHPRAAGTFPRFYDQFVKNGGIDLYHGVEKMTALPAARLGFADKGRLNVGADADVTIFDPEALKDGATFESPMIAPTGVDYVLIGGEIAAKDCAIVNPACGTAVRAH